MKTYTAKPQDIRRKCRGAGARLIGEGLRTKARQPSYLYVNNRLEGNALVTIEAMIRRADPDLLDQDPQG